MPKVNARICVLLPLGAGAATLGPVPVRQPVIRQTQSSQTDVDLTGQGQWLGIHLLGNAASPGDRRILPPGNGGVVVVWARIRECC